MDWDGWTDPGGEGTGFFRRSPKVQVIRAEIRIGGIGQGGWMMSLRTEGDEDGGEWGGREEDDEECRGG